MVASIRLKERKIYRVEYFVPPCYFNVNFILANNRDNSFGYWVVLDKNKTKVFYHLSSFRTLLHPLATSLGWKFFAIYLHGYIGVSIAEGEGVQLDNVAPLEIDPTWANCSKSTIAVSNPPSTHSCPASL